jgi:putative ABC transport system ATP-binding protein
MMAEEVCTTVLPEKGIVLELDGLSQRLHDPQSGAEFVVEVDRPLQVLEGDFVAVLGPSGCGKTTLLSVLGLLRQPSQPEEIGVFRIRGSHRVVRGGDGFIDLKRAWCRRQHGLIEKIRRSHIGFALQSGELLPSLTVAENIAAPMCLNGLSRREKNQRVRSLIDAFGLRRQTGDDHYDLSKKRVNKPTAALNREMARGALEQFKLLEAGGSGSAATIMITHDEGLADEFANLIVRMAPVVGRPAGRIVDIIRKG